MWSKPMMFIETIKTSTSCLSVMDVPWLTDESCSCHVHIHVLHAGERFPCRLTFMARASRVADAVHHNAPSPRPASYTRRVGAATKSSSSPRADAGGNNVKRLKDCVISGWTFCGFIQKNLVCMDCTFNIEILFWLHPRNFNSLINKPREQAQTRRGRKMAKVWSNFQNQYPLLTAQSLARIRFQIVPPELIAWMARETLALLRDLLGFTDKHLKIVSVSIFKLFSRMLMEGRQISSFHCYIKTYRGNKAVRSWTIK